MKNGATIDEQVLIEESIRQQVKFYEVMEFSVHKKKIAAMSFQEKLNWYACQPPLQMVSLGNNREFKRFWLWHVMIPLRLKRLWYKLKNGEFFKEHKHISEVRQKKT